MKKQKNYIFFDEIFADYIDRFGEEGESLLVKDLKKHLEDLSKTSEITLITNQNVWKVTNWLLKNDLYQLADDITNSAI